MAVKRELLVVMKGAPDELLKSLDRAKRSFQTLGSELKSIGQSLTTAITLPVAGAALGIAKLAGDFEAGMNRVKALTGATGSEFQKLKDLAVDLGASTKFSAGEAADGMAFLAQAGFKTNEIVAAMPGLLDLAAAGQLDLGRAADIASNVLSGFGLNADQAGRAADVLAKAANSSNTSVEQLGTAMSYVAPIAKSVGLSMEETAAMIGKLSDAGIQGERAGTALRGALSSLLDPGGKALDVFDKLNISIRNTDGTMRPLLDVLAEMGVKSKDAGDFVKVFGREAASAAQVLADGVTDIREFTGELENSGGAAKQVAETMQQGLNGALEELGGALETLAITIADAGLLDFLKGLVQAATEMVRGLSQTNPELLKWAAILAGVAAAIGPVLIAIGSISGGIASLSGILAGTSAAWKGLMGAVAAAPAVWAGVTTAVSGAWAALAGLPATMVAAKAAIIGMLPSVAALQAGLLLLGKSVVVVAAGFAAWNLGAWAAKNIPVVAKIGDAMASLILKIPGLENALTGLGSAQEGLESQTLELEKALRAKGVTVDRTGLSTLEYSKALRAAAIEAGAVKGQTKQAEGGTSALADAMRAAMAEAQAMSDSLAGIGGNAKAAGDAMEAAVGPAERFSGEIKAMVSQETIDFIDKWRASWAKAVDEVKGLPKSISAAAKALDDLVTSFAYAGQGALVLGDALPPLNTSLNFTGKNIFALEEALKSAGITSIKVANEGIELLRGKLELAQMAFAQNLITVEQLQAVQEEYNTALGVTTSKQTALAALGKQISTIMTDLSRSIADAILGAGSLGEAFVNAAKAIAEAIIRTVVEGAMAELGKSLLKNTDLVGGLLNKFKDLFSFLDSKSGVSVGGTPENPGGGGGGSGMGGGGVGGLIIGAIQTGLLTYMVTILRRVEKDVGRMEVTTREIKAETMNRRQDAWDQFNSIMEKWDLAVQALWDIKSAVEGGLKVTGGGGVAQFVFEWPDDIKQALFSLKGFAEAIFFDVSAIRDAVGGTLAPEMLAQTDLLRDIKDQLEGILYALSGSETPPVVITNLNVNAASSDPRKLAQAIQTELEKAGSLRSGSTPAFAQG